MGVRNLDRRRKPSGSGIFQVDFTPLIYYTLEGNHSVQSTLKEWGILFFGKKNNNHLSSRNITLVNSDISVKEVIT